MAVLAARDTQASGHSGILESAKAVLEDLQTTGVLESLMLNSPVGFPLLWLCMVSGSAVPC